jgi:hypothetical protein
MKAMVLRNLRSAITLGLMLWCAGAGCMIVSATHGAAMRGAEATKSRSSVAGLGQVSGSAGPHDCCKARHASEHRIASSMTDQAKAPESLMNLEGAAEFPNTSDAMSCCPLTSGTIVATGRQRVSHNDTSVSRGLDTATVVTSVASTQLAPPLRLPNQNQTYLRGCAFLI